MDPTTALEEWIANRDRFVRYGLNEWIGKGGFRPRVQLSPATDAWMAGDRFGEVVKLGTKFVHLGCDPGGPAGPAERGSVMHYVFQRVSYVAHWDGACPVCHQPSHRQRTFAQTVSPFNRNPDGVPKTAREVYDAVKVEAAKHVPDFTHKACATKGRGAAVR